MQHKQELIIVIFFSIVGTFCIFASIFNWDFFFENRRVKSFVKFFGRKGARVFYVGLGLFLYFMSYKLMTT